MKFLKYLFLLILILLVIFFGKGLLTPSIDYDCSIAVNKSAAESWAVMSDEANLPKWIEGYKSSKLISGEPNTVGAVTEVTVDNGGQDAVMRETITSITQNELMAMNFTMDFMDMDYEMSFKEAGGQTTITTKSNTRGNGLFAKSMISFMGGSMKKQEEKNLASLKTLIDNNTKDYFPSTPIEAAEESPMD